MTSEPILKAPMPYFGGKSRIAPMVWERFGVVDNLIDPFFGSGAILLGAPWPADRTETVNDIDAHLCNFWRAVQHDPEQVAHFADWPVNETDLHSRHKWLIRRKPELLALLDADPDAYDARAAGWWVWGISCWIGSGWCAASPGIADVRDLTRKIPHVGSAGQGVNRVHALTGGARTEIKRPHLISNKGVHSARDAGAVSGAARQVPRLSGSQGIHRKLPELGSERGDARRAPSRQLPHVGDAGRGDAAPGIESQGGIYAYFAALSDRLRRVRVCCGDWTRVLGPSVTWRHGMTAVFLDPPYAQEGRADVYAHESQVFTAVREWAIQNGDNTLLRIAICGYDFSMPEGWVKVNWKAPGGYGSQGNGRGRENAAREVVWFSPSCLDLNALPLFAGLEDL